MVRAAFKEGRRDKPADRQEVKAQQKIAEAVASFALAFVKQAEAVAEAVLLEYPDS